MRRILTLLLCWSSPGLAAQQRVPGDVPVVVDLPTGTTHRHEERQVIIGRVASDTLVFERPEGWMAATVTQAPAFAMSLAGTDGVLSRARNSLLKDHHATSTSWTAVERDGRQGKRLVFATEDGRQGISEIYTWDNIVVTMTALMQPDASQAAIHTFFASVRWSDRTGP